MTMKPGSARARFNKMIKASDSTLEELTASEGLGLMLEFYRDIRAEGCDPDADGDMLFAQWGRFELGKGPAFHFRITRQFMVPAGEDEEDDSVSQLCLSFRHSLSPEFEKVEGDRWCETPDDIDTFADFMLPAAAALRDYKPLTIELIYDRP